MSDRGEAPEISRVGDMTTRMEIGRVGAEFSQWQGRRVAVVGGSRIGVPDDLLLLMDESGHEAIVIATQTPGDRFASWKENNDIYIAAETAVATGTPVGGRLIEAGFSLDRLGPCLNWKRVVDTATDERLLVSNEALRAVADPSSEIWLVGRQRGEDWIFVDGLDLETALSVVERLPSPDPGEETSIVGRDDALAFLDGREGPTPGGIVASSGVHASGRSGP